MQSSSFSRMNSLKDQLAFILTSVWEVQVGDGSMQCVSAVPSLQALVLGFTKVQDPGLAMLATLPSLTHLALTAEGITEAGLLVTALTSQALSARPAPHSCKKSDLAWSLTCPALLHLPSKTKSLELCLDM